MTINSSSQGNTVCAGISLLEVLTTLVLITFIGGALLVLQLRLSKDSHELLRQYREVLVEHPITLP